MAVICVPMPPAFLALPLRQIMLPFIGPFPVSSQTLAITLAFLDQRGRTIPASFYMTRVLSLDLLPRPALRIQQPTGGAHRFLFWCRGCRFLFHDLSRRRRLLERRGLARQHHGLFRLKQFRPCLQGGCRLPRSHLIA